VLSIHSEFLDFILKGSGLIARIVVPLAVKGEVSSPTFSDFPSQLGEVQRFMQSNHILLIQNHKIRNE
jgi:hypothetical protein